MKIDLSDATHIEVEAEVRYWEDACVNGLIDEDGSRIFGREGDLEALRAGKISVNDAIARSMLAKQIFNGVRIYLNGTKILSENAKAIPAVKEGEQPS